MDDLIGIEDDTNLKAEECKVKKINEDQDRVKALEMRKRVMQSLGETKEQGNTSGEGKKRRSAKKVNGVFQKGN